MASTSPRASAQASSADLNKVRIAFMERASAPNVPPFAFKLAHLLAYKYMNRKSWSARPAQETLARDLNVSVRTVQGKCLRTSPSAGRENALARDKESSPSAGAPPLTRHPADLVLQPQAKSQTEPVAAKGTPEGELAERVEFNAPAVIVGREEQNWRELRALWDRGWASDDTPKAQAIARQAFAKACREIDDPADIIEAAKTYVAAADAPRFLPALPQWLAARGWETPPPTKRRAGSARRGNGHNKPNGYAKPDMFEITLEAGGYRKDANGNLYWPGDDARDDEPLRTSMWGGGQ